MRKQEDGSCVCGHAEDASYTFGILLHFICLLAYLSDTLFQMTQISILVYMM